jgi:hypothetical protein
MRGSTLNRCPILAAPACGCAEAHGVRCGRPASWPASQGTAEATHCPVRIAAATRRVHMKLRYCPEEVPMCLLEISFRCEQAEQRRAEQVE